MGFMDVVREDTRGDNKVIVPQIIQVQKQDSKFSCENTERWLEDNELTDEHKFIALIMGEDSTGKSPTALSYLTDEDIRQGKRVIALDLDGGIPPILTKYHRKRCEDLGRELEDVFLVRNPISEKVENNEVSIDYATTFNKIKAVVNLLKNTDYIKRKNIKYVILDGLSTLLKYAENQMRIEKHIQPDNGVSQIFWKIRAEKFRGVIDMMISLPVSSFFVAHSDFLIDEKDKPSIIVAEMNAKVHQKIKLEKIYTKNETIFRATILKTKYEIKNDGKIIDFGRVNLENGEVKFEPEKILEGLI